MNEPDTTSGPAGADRTTSAASVARWRAEVVAFADRMHAELQELMGRAGHAGLARQREPESSAASAVSVAPLPGSGAGGAGPGPAERDSETRLRSLREQFAAKLRRFERDGAAPGSNPVPAEERGNDEHE